jgi:hypothetical protein
VVRDQPSVRRRGLSARTRRKRQYEWNSHEPASILHHLVFLPDPYESMQFLIDRGIDLTIKDYRWDSNGAGWARHGNNDEKMAQWLEEAERRRK